MASGRVAPWLLVLAVVAGPARAEANVVTRSFTALSRWAGNTRVFHRDGLLQPLGPEESAALKLRPWQNRTLRPSGLINELCRWADQGSQATR